MHLVQMSLEPMLLEPMSEPSAQEAQEVHYNRMGGGWCQPIHFLSVLGGVVPLQSHRMLAHSIRARRLSGIDSGTVKIVGLFMKIVHVQYEGLDAV